MMSLIEFARRELQLLGYDAEDAAAMLDILRIFFDRWDSGGAVHVVAPHLLRLINGQPLTPLTGDDDEWMEVGDGVYQNVRCSTVFKKTGGKPYDIDNPGQVVFFPYWPKTSLPSSPVVEI